MTATETLGVGTSPEGVATPTTSSERPGVVARGLILAVRGYQLLRAGRPSGCRYLPSCSAYAVEAIGTHGALPGARLALRRLLRCHPWGGSGFDPVPDQGVPCSR